MFWPMSAHHLLHEEELLDELAHGLLGLPGALRDALRRAPARG